MSEELLNSDLSHSSFQHCTASYLAVLSLITVSYEGLRDLSRLVHRLLQNLECSWIGWEVLLLTFDPNLSNAVCRRCWGGMMLLRTGSQSRGVVLIVPDIMRMLWLSLISTFLVCVLFNHTGEQYSATE
jgi:hypothetical protein